MFSVDDLYNNFIFLEERRKKKRFCSVYIRLIMFFLKMKEINSLKKKTVMWYNSDIKIFHVCCYHVKKTKNQNIRVTSKTTLPYKVNFFFFIISDFNFFFFFFILLMEHHLKTLEREEERFFLWERKKVCKLKSFHTYKKKYIYNAEIKR